MVYHKDVIKKRKKLYKEVLTLTVRERILGLRLLEKQKENPEMARQLGINVKMVEKKKRRKLKLKGGE